MDEAGRGPLAGPVYAAAVVLPPDFPPGVLNDSKKLSEKKRLSAFSLIVQNSLWGIASVDHEEIDMVNILNASMKAMSLAFENMREKLPGWLLERGIFENDFRLHAVADGNRTPCVRADIVECVVKADSKIPAVMAASILAKVSRDEFMKEMDALYSGYGYARHKGYPTKSHRQACRTLGPSPIQRLTFKY